MEMIVKPSNIKNKRLTAIFSKNGKKIKTIHFGLKNPKKGTYIDHSDKLIRKNYIARHEVREKKFYDSPLHASTLSRFILWGSSDNLQEAIKLFKKKFNLK